MKNRVIYWPLYTLVGTFLIVGLLFKFNYFREVEIQLHDTYLVVLPLHFGVLFWVLITFVLFLVRGLKSKFSDKTGTWILLIFNSLILVLMLLITYTMYVFLGAYAVIDLSRTLIICAVLILLILAGEFFLIRRLVRLKTAKQIQD
jgi:hypothetical protein